MNNERPQPRLVDEAHQPRLLEMVIRSVDNGYIVSAAFNGHQASFVTYTIEDIIGYLNTIVEVRQ